LLLDSQTQQSRWLLLTSFLASNFHSNCDPSATRIIDSDARRAVPNASSGYTPKKGDCPSPGPSIRSAGSLSPNENAWLEKRRSKTIDSMGDLLGRLNISDFDAPAYINQNAGNVSALPNIAVAVSGGGYRAMLNAAGAVAAFDSRTENSTGPGRLGGILQSATYISGLSGGAWFVGSLYINNFTTVPALLKDNSVWQLENSILEGPPHASNYYRQLVSVVQGKEDAGFNTSITDYWLV
jgi:lysophospholipase